MSKNCPSCQAENSVEEDDYHGQQQQVCMACGLVVSTNYLASEELRMSELLTAKSQTLLNVKQLSSGIRNYICSSNKSSRGLKIGLNMVKILSSHYNLPEYMTKEVEELYERAYRSDHVIHTTLKFKENLAAACVYAKMRQNNWPISVNNICFVVKCNKEEISHSMSVLNKHFNIVFQSASVEELTETFLDTLKITDEIEKENIKEKTTALLALSRECWLTTSKSPRACIFAAAFLVWKQLSPLTPKFSNIRAFCRQFGIQYQVAMTSFTQEMKKTLVKLCKELPWLKYETINQNNVLEYLDDILKYSKCLQVQAIENYKMKCKDKDMLKELNEDEVGFHAFRNAVKRKLSSEPFNPNISMTVNEEEINSYICTESEVAFKKKYANL